VWLEYAGRDPADQEKSSEVAFCHIERSEA